MAASTEPQRILKANAARSLGSKVVFDYEDIHRQCEDTVESARQRAELMLAEAKSEAEEIRRRAHADGLAAGCNEGFRDLEREIQSRASLLADQLAAEGISLTLPALNELIEAVNRQREQWLAEWETAGIQLSVAIAERIVRRELMLKPESVSHMLAETLQLAAGNVKIRLRLHPADIQCLGDHAQQVVLALSSCGEVVLVSDEAITRGGCIVESQQGVIDARIETQLTRIADELLQVPA